MHIAYLYVLNIFRLTYILLHLARAQMTCIHISHLKWLFFKKNKNAFYSIFPASRIFLLANWMASNVQLWRKQLNGIECTCSGFEENNCLHKVKCCLFAIFFQHFLQHLSTILLLKTNWRSFQYLFLETSRNRKPTKDIPQ